MNTPPKPDWISRFSRSVGTLVPDATSASAILLVILVAAALALGNGVTATADAYYRGLWMLLPFTMQMTLILVLSSVASATAVFRNSVVRLAQLPRNMTQLVALAVCLNAALSYLYWGLALALGPLIAIHFARAAERKGILVDFPFLLATVGAAASVWQFGLSSSAPLLMATPGNFLEATTGVMSLRSTIWAPSAILLCVTFPIALVVVARLLMPRSPQPLSAFPEANNLAAPAPEGAMTDPPSESTGFAGWAERSRVMTGILVVAMVGWLYHHFVTKQAGLDLNAMNTMLLLLCFLLHRNVASFSRAMQGAVQTCWPILVLYQLYGGVAGLLQYTSVGETFAGLFASVSTHLTFPLMTAIAATVVAVFVPSSGGQWVIQGFVTTKAAAAVGLTAQRGLLALSVGDQMGNLVSPFWPVLAAGIARVDFRKFFGYGLVFAALWFVMGVLIFTLVP